MTSRWRGCWSRPASGSHREALEILPLLELAAAKIDLLAQPRRGLHHRLQFLGHILLRSFGLRKQDQDRRGVKIDPFAEALPSTPEVHATWADLRPTTSVTFGSSRASRGPPGHTRWGVTSNRYGPGFAASSGDSQRYFRAHSAMLIRGGGDHLRAIRRTALIAVFFKALFRERVVSIPV